MKIRTWGAAALLLAGVAIVPATTASATTPSAGTTGVVAGVTLTPMAGGYISTGSATIQNKVITGDATFTGSNLTLRNVRITGHVIFRSGTNITIEDSEFGSWALSGSQTVRATRVEVFGNSGQDGLHITSMSGTGNARDIVIKDSWIHNPIVKSTSHYDGIQVRGVDGLTLDNDVIDLGAYKPQFNAALFLEDVTVANRNVTVTGSRLLGGGYVLYNDATNTSITTSVLGSANFGILYPSSDPIATFTGNTSPTGYVLTCSGTTVTTTTTQTAPSPTPTPTTSPTPTPTPTPSPSPTTTAGTPTAATTGVPAGATLATMSGGYIRTAGTTIANKVITGDATFVGDDLTLRNVRVTGTAILRGDRVTVVDSEFGALVLSGTAGATVTRADVFGVRGKDGIQITAGSGPVTGVAIRDSWVHNPVITSGTTYAGVEVRGVDGLTLDNVLVDLGAFKPELPGGGAARDGQRRQQERHDQPLPPAGR